MNFISLSNNLLISCFSYMSKTLITPNSTFIGLAAPGDVGSWQIENKVCVFCDFTLCFGIEVIKWADKIEFRLIKLR